ncbi:putative ALIX V-shaped domain-containing protein [Helianthus annuus]|nr:putative ALIX V-shaped domain-containing protein [Helianthus annuus]KAJ0474940.1 putative ALIX V-shaped domain-containing protein [Helianthus annuus]KAJ0654247.1 putative ALIX V-shaped domain-containing protein [Helianthus annuus]KAJ0846935.1 putative ALIX V-shaped domain-containing protein [Helianthus annuus]
MSCSDVENKPLDESRETRQTLGTKIALYSLYIFVLNIDLMLLYIPLHAAACEKCYKQIEVAIARYREIKDKINEGLKFYVTLQEATTSVKQQCSDFVMTRSIQCRDMIEDVQKQMSGLSIQDGKNSSAYNYSSTRPSQQPSSQSEPPTNQPHPQTPYYHPTATTLL